MRGLLDGFSKWAPAVWNSTAGTGRVKAQGSSKDRKSVV